MTENGKRSRILLVDDDSLFLQSVELLLRKYYDFVSATSVSQALSILARQKEIDLVVSDLDFKGQHQDGLVLIDWVFDHHPDIPVLVLSGDQKTERIVNAMRRKLVNFIGKNSHLEDRGRELRSAIESGLSKRCEIQALKNNPKRYLTKDETILRSLDQMDILALKQAEICVLITGETGTGKEIIAQHLSAIFNKHLVAANMANLNENNAESELFGHERGAFTGAHANKLGLIEKAHNGIFFLDEIGEATLSVQTKLLRTLESGELRRLGSTQDKKVNVQFIGATNRDLRQMIDLGKFRLDLYTRLASFRIHLPPLRERLHDLEYYLNIYLEKHSQNEQFVLTASGLDAAKAYSWPGNIRELRDFVKTTTAISSKKEIDDQAVENWKNIQGTSSFLTPTQSSSQIDRNKILKALHQSNGNRTLAAEILDIDPSTLHRHLKRLDIGSLVSAKTGRPSKLVTE